jgi:hypothetical protein
MEVYFSVHEVKIKQNIAFTRLNLKGHALAWWVIDVVGRALENEPPIIKWEVFKDMIKVQFYAIEYEEHRHIVWHYFR